MKLKCKEGEHTFVYSHPSQISDKLKCVCKKFTVLKHRNTFGNAKLIKIEKEK